MSEEKKSCSAKPTLTYALVTIGILCLFIIVSLTVLNFPITVTLFFSWLLLAPFAMKLGYTVAEMEEHVYDMIKYGVGMFALLLAIGCMVSIWICAGTVPTLIYWGLNVITPKIFLLIAFLVCTVVSIPTGTSWGTASTVGVAMMGVGMGLGIQPGLVAGAVISGAYVGDVLSPVSDTPLLTSTVCEVPVMSHIRHNLFLVVPSVLISAVIYGIYGMLFVDSSLDATSLAVITETLAETFHIGILTLIPLAVVLGLLAAKQSSLSAIMAGCVVGAVIAVLYQGFTPEQVFNFMATGFSMETGNELLDPILDRGGISSMQDLISMVVAALGMGGILKGCGFLDTLVESLSGVIHSRIGLTVATTVGCSLCVVLVGTNYFSMILNGTMMAPLYQKLGYQKVNASVLANNLSCAGSFFVPWGMGALFFSATLGATFSQMAPFIFFNMVLILLNVLTGFLGVLMPRERDDTGGQRIIS